jgi:phage baseplate assembly protein W
MASYTYRGFSTVSKYSQKKFKLNNHELIKQDILNAVYTKEGDRPMQPTYGCIVWNKLFDNLKSTDVESIATNIQSLIGSDPRITIASIDVSQSNNSITLTLVIQYTDTNEIETMKVDFSSTPSFS